MLLARVRAYRIGFRRFSDKHIERRQIGVPFDDRRLCPEAANAWV